MGTVADKLTYLNTTKGKLKDVINMTDANIDANTTFRNYAQALYDGYINVLKDRDTLLDNMNRGTSTGSISDSANLPMYEDKMSKLSTQNGTQGTNIISLDTEKYKVNLGVGDKITVTNNSSGARRIHLYTNIDDENYNDYCTIQSNETKTITIAYASTAISWNNIIQGGLAWANLGSSALPYEEYTGGIPSPNPEYPQEVNTVKGYRNLFDKDNASYKYGYIKNDSGNDTESSLSSYLLSYIEVEPNKKYTIQGRLVSSSNGCRIYFYDNNKNWISRTNVIWNVPVSFETPNNCYYIQFQYTQSVYDDNTVQINEGNVALPYVPYGTNWIYTTISDGTNSRITTLPLNDNEIAGIGDYKDEYIVDKYGHCYLNKKTGKLVLNGSEDGWADIGGNAPYSISINGALVSSSNNDLPNILVSNFTTQSYGGSWTVSNYLACAGGTSYPSRIRFRNTDINSLANWKTWLSTHNTEIYYVLETENLIDLNYNVDLTLYSGTNNITNSEDMDMAIKYIKDTYE